MPSSDTTAQWVRWGVGTVATLAIPLILYTLSAINETNARQDVQLTQVREGHHESELRQERVYRELGDQFEKTARVLEGLVEKVEAVDERGSRALRAHEDNHDRFGRRVE